MDCSLPGFSAHGIFQERVLQWGAIAFSGNARDLDSIPGSGKSLGEGISYPLQDLWSSLVAQMVKNPPAMQETWVRSLGWKSLGRGHGNPLQYSCPENPIDRGAWQATVHGVTKSRTQLND